MPFAGEAAIHYAAVARAADAILATANTAEFARVPGLAIENWLQP